MMEIMSTCNKYCPVFRKWSVVVPPSFFLQCASLYQKSFGWLFLTMCIKFLLLRDVILIFISRPFRNQLGLFLNLLTYFGHWWVIYPLQCIFSLWCILLCPLDTSEAFLICFDSLGSLFLPIFSIWFMNPVFTDQSESKSFCLTVWNPGSKCT